MEITSFKLIFGISVTKKTQKAYLIKFDLKPNKETAEAWLPIKYCEILGDKEPLTPHRIKIPEWLFYKLPQNIQTNCFSCALPIETFDKTDLMYWKEL